MPKPHRQLRLPSISVTRAEKQQAELLVREKAEDAKSVADLVRKLLAQRFVRRMAERAERQRASETDTRTTAVLVGGEPRPAVEPTGVDSAGDATAKRAKRRTGKRLLGASTVLVVRERAGHSTGASTKKRRANDRLS